MSARARGGTFGAVLLLGLAGCGLLGSKDGPALDASWSSFDRLQLVLTPRPADDSTIDAELRLAGGDWQAVEGQQGTGGSLALDLDPATPERSTIQVRARSRQGNQVSGWAETTVTRGVRPPSPPTAQAAAATTSLAWTSPITVRWENRSQVATALELERLDLSDGGRIRRLAVAAGASVQVDDDGLAEGATYRYRVRAGVDGTWSEWAEGSDQVSIALLQPIGLTVVKEAGGVRVSWQPRSRAITKQFLQRSSGDFGLYDTLEELHWSAGTYLDPLAAWWPTLSYRVYSANDGFTLTAVSPPARITPYTLPGSPSLRASAVELGAGQAFARDGQGRLHSASAWPGDASVSRGVAGGRDRHVLSGLITITGAPQLGLDGADHLHVVYPRAGVPESGPAQMIHEWHDGTAWQQELVPLQNDAPARRSSYFSGVAADGAVHVAIPPLGGEAMPWAAKEGGHWVVGTVPAFTFTDVIQGPFRFALARDGTAYALGCGSNASVQGCRLRVRPPGGAWGEEEEVAACFPRTECWLVPADGGQGAVLSVAQPLVPQATELWLSRRGAGGGFGAPELVASLPGFNAIGEVVNGAPWVASTPDGSRVAVAVDASYQTDVWIRDAGPTPTWRAVQPGPGNAGQWTLGFDSNGAFWGLAGASWTGETTAFSLFEAQ